MKENDTTEEKVFIIKCRFKSVSNKIYGILFIKFNAGFHMAEITKVIIASYSAVFMKPLELFTGESLNGAISELIYKGDYHKKQTVTLQNTLDNSLKDPTFVNDLDNAIKDKEYKRAMGRLFEPMLGKALYDKKIVMEIALEMDSSSTEDSIHEQEIHQVQADSLEDTPDMAVEEIMINTTFVLSPVGGKVVRNIQPNDIVMAMIVHGGPNEDNLISQYHLSEGAGKIVQPIPGKVISNTQVENKPQHKLRIQFDTHIFSEILEEINVNVKLFYGSPFVFLSGNMPIEKSQTPNNTQHQISQPVASIDLPPVKSHKNIPFVQISLFLLIGLLFSLMGVLYFIL